MYIENYELIVISLILNQLHRIHQFFLLWQRETLLPLSSIYLFEHSLYVIPHHYHPLTTPAYTDTLLTLSGLDTSCQVALLYKCSLYPTWTPIPNAKVPLPPHIDAFLTSLGLWHHVPWPYHMIVHPTLLGLWHLLPDPPPPHVCSHLTLLELWHPKMAYLPVWRKRQSDSESMGK